MRLTPVLSLVAALVGSAAVDARAVFAHFMVGNVRSFSQADWEADIALAQETGIDAFALNIAANDGGNENSLAKAFAAADGKGFKLFFSFDYQADGVWAPGRVVDLVNRYKVHSSYYHHQDRPFVSTFEGPGNANDWGSIKSSTGAFFVPDWDSLGPDNAVGAGNAAADGLFNWDAWPVGATDMNTAKDDNYKRALNGKPYMMGVSPWFYTNLPGWSKNWLWRGDDLWFDRWQQVIQLAPEFVEIITWNDWGESHYIAPLDSEQWGLFQSGSAPYNYAQDMPHDAWRKFLPYVIQQYKTGAASVDREGLTTWFRRSPAGACGTGSTAGNAPYQQPIAPTAVVQDRVFYSALLTSAADVTVSISGNAAGGTWDHVPEGGSGLYHGSAAFNGRTGAVVVTITRNGNEVTHVNGESISTSCINGITNWNAWTGFAWADGAGNGGGGSGGGGNDGGNGGGNGGGGGGGNPGDVCISGSGEGNFGGLCSFACHYGYCPAPCTCTAMGAQVQPPAATGLKGYPKVGVADHCSYVGLCSFAWDQGYTDNTSACGPDPAGANGC